MSISIVIKYVSLRSLTPFTLGMYQPYIKLLLDETPMAYISCVTILLVVTQNIFKTLEHQGHTYHVSNHSSLFFSCYTKLYLLFMSMDNRTPYIPKRSRPRSAPIFPIIPIYLQNLLYFLYYLTFSFLFLIFSCYPPSSHFFFSFIRLLSDKHS